MPDADDALLNAYLDGDLNKQLRSEVRQRLRIDPALAASLTALQLTFDVLATLPELPFEAPLATTLLARISTAASIVPTTVSDTTPHLRVLLATQGLLAVLVFAVDVLVRLSGLMSQVSTAISVGNASFQQAQSSSPS